MICNLSFDQYVTLASVVIAILSLAVTICLTIVNHKSSAKILIKEKQIECYCNLAFTLQKIKKEGLTKEHTNSFMLFSSYALLLGNNKVIHQLTYCVEKISKNDFSSDDIAQTFEILKNSIRNHSIFSAF